MNLNYSVLWFDDYAPFFDSLDLDDLQAKIGSWGFTPRIVQVKTAEEFNSHSPYQHFDLIVVDYNLEEQGHGAEFIVQLREHQVFTEVIFYTAGNAASLWDAVRENQLEGVYIATRATVDDKIKNVGRQAVRKVLDLENMRGIVMAEVGDLDQILDSILSKGIESLDDGKKKEIFNKFHAAVAKHSSERAKDIAAFEVDPSVGALIKLCDSDKRWQNFNRLKGAHKSVHSNGIGDYVEDILRPRNFLAHGTPEIHPDGGYLFHFHGKQYHFTDTESITLRHKILSYKKHFQKIHDDLTA